MTWRVENHVLNVLGPTWFESNGWSWSLALSVISWKSSAVYNWVVYWHNCHEISVN